MRCHLYYGRHLALHHSTLSPPMFQQRFLYAMSPLLWPSFGTTSFHTVTADVPAAFSICDVTSTMAVIWHYIIPHCHRRCSSSVFYMRCHLYYGRHLALHHSTLSPTMFQQRFLYAMSPLLWPSFGTTSFHTVTDDVPAAFSICD